MFQFESDPASGWLVPDQCKLYARFSVGTKGQIGRIGESAPGAKARVPSQSLRFAACPIYGALSASVAVSSNRAARGCSVFGSM